ncbi:MAG TPA: AI-2E family transporter [Actinomycetales bacterium]|nr:AI-2E family transporter [Actinomycetales bacterium]
MREQRAESRFQILPNHPRTRVIILVSVTIILLGLAIQMIYAAFHVVSPVLIPTAVALLLTGLLMPLQVLLNHRLRFPRPVAAVTSLLVAIAVVAGLLAVSGMQLLEGWSELQSTASLSLEELPNWIDQSELPISGEQVNGWIETGRVWLEENQSAVTSGVLGFGAGFASVVVGILLCLVGTFFFLADGDRIASWLIMRLPNDLREQAYEAGRRGWVTLGTYTRTQLVVSAVDAIGIGIGAWILGVPFVIPIIALTFVLCFIPMVGAILAGAIVVLIALGFEGMTSAIIMLIIVVAVQQIESNLLAPLLLGRAVNVHPIGVLIGVALGTYLLGLVGALFAVPLMSMINSMSLYLSDRDPFPGLDAGGRALVDPPRKLMGEAEPAPIPRRIGQATPRWVQMDARRRAKINEEGLHFPNPGAPVDESPADPPDATDVVVESAD